MSHQMNHQIICLMNHQVNNMSHQMNHQIICLMNHQVNHLMSHQMNHQMYHQKNKIHMKFIPYPLLVRKIGGKIS